MIAPLAAVATAVVTVTAPSMIVFTIKDPRVTEASGISRGIVSPGVYYVHNDSGDSARFFAVDAGSGALRAVYRVPGATNHDWEDLAVAPDAAGTPSVWLADIGDNNAGRREVQIYRVDEPRVDMSAHDVVRSTARPDVWRLRYPTGPTNAESLAVTPTGRAYVVTKTDTGIARVYAVPPRPDPDQVRTMREIGRIRVRVRHPTVLYPAGLQRETTGAAISRDGRLLAVRTYRDVYLWQLRDDDVAAALRHPPVVQTLPLQRQGEGVCIVGTRLILDSEGSDSPVWSDPIPAAVLSAPAPAGQSSSSASHAPVPSAVSSAASSAPPSASPSAPGTSSAAARHRTVLGVGPRAAFVLAVIVLGVAGWFALRRPRRGA